MITLDDYWMGRDIKYRLDLNEDIIQNAHITVDRINELLMFVHDDIGMEFTEIASGWRPPSVNDATANAAKTSTHLSGQACDLRDTPDRDLARWCLRRQPRLASIGLWMEDPQWTPTWVHLQIRPPKSGLRVYIPSTKPAMVAKLPEQGGVA
jgi:hypothetical protein